MLSPHYTAPEAWGQLLKKSLNLFWDDAIGISAESDAWSFACRLVEMDTGFVPHMDQLIIQFFFFFTFWFSKVAYRKFYACVVGLV